MTEACAPAPRVDVLLATYNSAAYLAPMLESLAAQSWRDFRLVVSDDGSTDATEALIDAHRSAFANPVLFRRRVDPTGGAAGNFSSLLAACDADIAFLADHDDVWAPDKVEKAVARLQAEAQTAGADAPILLHGDLRVIDAEGREIAPSYWRFKSIRPDYGARLNTALMHATVTGCTAALNRALLDRLRATPPDAIMHDWWINLVAVVFGRVIWDPEPRILYRVHGRNASRPTRVTPRGMLSRFDRIADLRRTLGRRFDQAEALLAAYDDALPPRARAVLEDFVALRRLGPLRRRWRWLRGGYFFPQTWRNAAIMAGL